MAKGSQKPSGSTKTAFKKGDAIRGERIVAQYRKISRPVVAHGSSTHKIVRVKLEGSVMCVIDRPLNYLR